jgi:NTP pyrophosphatase (non-canonical NTP hydrolase)
MIFKQKNPFEELIKELKESKPFASFKDGLPPFQKVKGCRTLGEFMELMLERTKELPPCFLQEDWGDNLYDKKEILKISSYYGIRKQFHKLVEECGELIVASQKTKLQGDCSEVQYLIEEIANVMVVAFGIVEFLGYLPRLKDTMDFKIKRQLKRIEEEGL